MQLSLTELLWVLPLGALFLTILTTSQGLIGRRQRQQLAQIAAGTFGAKWGAGLLNLLMVIGMIGWGGFQGGVSGASAAQLFQLPGWAGALLIIIVLYVMSEFGISRWAALAWVTTGSAVALTIFTLLAVDLTPTAARASEPPSVALWLWAFGTIVSYATLFSLRNPDFSWDLESDAGVVKANLFLLFPLLFAMLAGALLYRATGNWNIADVLNQAQWAELGHIFLLVSVISPLISGWYSGSLALSSVTPLSIRQSTILICILGFVLAATRFDQQLLPFLGVLGASLSPALFTILTARLFSTRLSTNKTLAAWLVGAAVAILFQTQGMVIHIFMGAFASISCVVALQWFDGWRK